MPIYVFVYNFKMHVKYLRKKKFTTELLIME